MKYYFKKNIGAIVVSFIFIVFSLIFCIVGNESKILESDLRINKYDINLEFLYHLTKQIKAVAQYKIKPTKIHYKKSY